MALALLTHVLSEKTDKNKLLQVTTQLLASNILQFLTLLISTCLICVIYLGQMDAITI